MHALSLGTWWIHIASVLEWMAAMLAIQGFGRMRREGGWRWLSLAMLPALASAMAACTWHLFDNSAELKGLVVLQAGLTTVGNATLAIAAWNLLRHQTRDLDAPPLATATGANAAHSGHQAPGAPGSPQRATATNSAAVMPGAET